MKNNNLSISEKFYSIQGEGQTMGIPSIFIRLSGCNLLCKSEDWICDSIEVWKKGTKTSFKDVLTIEDIAALKNGAHLIFTGGEPLLHQNKIESFLGWFYIEYNFLPTIEIETNGTITPSAMLLDLIKYWNCSPKLSNSGESIEKRIKPIAISFINAQKHSIFKFVISKSSDVRELIKVYSSNIDSRKIMLMPSGESTEELNKTRLLVIGECLKYGFRYSDRLHIVIWNKKTGV